MAVYISSGYSHWYSLHRNAMPNILHSNYRRAMQDLIFFFTNKQLKLVYKAREKSKISPKTRKTPIHQESSPLLDAIISTDCRIGTVMYTLNVCFFLKNQEKKAKNRQQMAVAKISTFFLLLSALIIFIILSPVTKCIICLT